MIDHLFAATLAFCVLAGGTLAFGHEWLAGGHAAATLTSNVEIQQLPRVVVIGKRQQLATTLARNDAADGVMRADQ